MSDKSKAPADADAPEPIAKIRLLKPHTHAGRDYEAGTEIELALIGMSEQDAAWLITIKAAERV